MTPSGRHKLAWLFVCGGIFGLAITNTPSPNTPALTQVVSPTLSSSPTSTITIASTAPTPTFNQTSVARDLKTALNPLASINNEPEEEDEHSADFNNIQTTSSPLPTVELEELEQEETLPESFLSPSPRVDNENGKVTRVIDGDTIDVLLSGRIERVRLIGIDTPETVDPRKPVQCFGLEASSESKSLLSDRTVELVADSTQNDRDKYGRLLRYVYLQDGTFVQRRLLQEGFAHEYTYIVPYRFQREFREDEQSARDNSRGLWHPNACSDKPATDCLIKGNISANGEKIYHLPSGDYYAKTVISTDKGERWFCSEDEATDAGWRKSKI